MCTSYLFIDASTDAHEEEEEVYTEEEEETCLNCINCTNCTNQGKLTLVQASKDTMKFVYLGNLTNPQFLFCKLLFIKVLFIVHLCLSLALLQVFQGLL